MNDVKLKLAVARKLPDVIAINEATHDETNTQFYWIEYGMRSVLETEWLHIVSLVEGKLTRLGNKGHEYILNLWEVTGLQKLRGPILLSSQSKPEEFRLQIDKLWELWVMATFNQRATALVRVLGQKEGV